MMFRFSGLALAFRRVNAVYAKGFPHSDIPGSQVAKHLPEAYRSHATSFIAAWCQGIHRAPLMSITTLFLAAECAHALAAPSAATLLYLLTFTA